MTTIAFILLHIAVLAYALISGVFLAFSDFIMRALARTGGSGGIGAMQVINREVFRWVFMGLFIGLAPLSLVIAAYGWLRVGGGPGILITIAGLTYLVGCLGVTLFFNVPMNEALAKMQPGAEATRAYWTGTYLPRWTFWNSLRTIASGASAGMLLFGLTWAMGIQAA